MEIEYMQRLLEIREKLEERIPWFPDNCCQLASRVVHVLTGLEELGGICIISDDYEVVHSCNFDPELDLHIDLTMDQYRKNIDTVYIKEARSSYFIPKPERTEFVRNFDARLKKFKGAKFSEVVGVLVSELS